MNITNEILERSKSMTLIDAICDLVEGSEEIDYHDVADIIKDNPTMAELLRVEFEKRNMIPADPEDLNLTEIFNGL